MLQKANIVLDLCAAPGGWTQVCARTCSNKAHIIAVDILPIRAFSGHKNKVTTIVGDITTDQCKADINRAVNSHQTLKKKQAVVDLVLHDGAPNIGASYDKDAYQQVELSVHALRCATQHLKKHGTFVTKLYRSRDYASYLWVVQQLFGTVNVLKPKASRSQSAEIFLICQDYLAPEKIDPRLLDPAHIFEFVEGDTTVANTQLSKNFNVFHKSWDTQKRHRDGYDDEVAFQKNFRNILPVSEFVESKSATQAITLLSEATGFSFACPKCSEAKSKKETRAPVLCHCQTYLHHPLTTEEVKECVTDLKVLNKSDFKGLLVWREKMQASVQAQDDEDGDEEDENENDVADDGASGSESHDSDDDRDMEEAEIQDEIKQLRQRKIREAKRAKKKERAKMAKKRRQAALGMDLNAIDVPDHDQIFSLATLTSKGDLEAVAEVDLDKVTHEEAFGRHDDSDRSDDEAPDENQDRDEETGYSYRLDREMDEAYERYLSATKNGAAKRGTKTAKRSKKLMREKLAEEAHEDQEILLANAKGVDKDTKAYVQLLQGNGSEAESSEDEDGADESDGFHDEPMTPSEHAARANQVKAALSSKHQEKNPLIKQFKGTETNSAKTARWFSNPLFAEIGQVANAANSRKKRKNEDIDDFDSGFENSESDSSNKEGAIASKKDRKSATNGLDAEDVLAAIPKTDKQIRHEKRLKAIARDERRQKRKARRLGESQADFDLAPAAENDDDDDDDDTLDQEKLASMSDEKRHKVLAARDLIKAGMGSVNHVDDNAGSKFEVVDADRPLPAADSRKYDSDHEDYDSDDYAQTLALGTMMLRRSKAKQLVDASYNRYAWNDPSDLPEWFVDDEAKHYRPQLPIPPALMAKMKEKMMALSAKPIAKVAEARARKNRMAKAKLAAAKKKAAAVAGSSEMSETMKLKAISKALQKGGDNSKRPGKQYVVAKKGVAKQGGKGIKVVDKRMKNDKRSMDRAKKGGKRGGLTGSKKRRHHK